MFEQGDYICMWECKPRKADVPWTWVVCSYSKLSLAKQTYEAMSGDADFGPIQYRNVTITRVVKA